MATRKVGSRPIVVDGVAYRWRIRHRATNLQSDYGVGTLHVAVQLAADPGSVLQLRTDRPHPADWNREREIVPVLPSDVEIWIRQAISLGWSPAKNGPTFNGQVIGGDVKLV
ncbi:MAG TPA: hypothetical protein VH370_07180 [Humisphaera sp.]|jgi:hypothetical protein|nr:hypothetical protein [Humisphaera sp.]